VPVHSKVARIAGVRGLDTLTADKAARAVAAEVNAAIGFRLF
jgi:hypothetical protein